MENGVLHLGQGMLGKVRECQGKVSAAYNGQRNNSIFIL